MNYHDRRTVCVRLSYECLNSLSERLGHGSSWSLAGGVDLSMILWLVNYFIDQGELPQDAIVSWVWPDPSWGMVCVLIHSDTYEVVRDGDPAPYANPLVDRHAFDKAIEEAVEPRVCPGCGGTECPRSGCKHGKRSG